MLAGSIANLAVEYTVAVPVVRSTRRGSSSRLCASIGMAVAYVRGDRLGDVYRDRLELCLRGEVISLPVAAEMSRRLFPDVPVSAYGPDELEVDDAVTLARLAAQRESRVLPVLLYDTRFLPDDDLPYFEAVVLSSFHPEDPARRSFWDTEPPQVGGWRTGNRVLAVPPGFQCMVFGWMPPSADRA